MSEFLLKREVAQNRLGFQGYTLGTLYLDGKFLCYTVEDLDRKIESGGTKVQGQTAIPRGEYEISVSYSNRFQKELPILMNVPQFEGIRIHGGNTAEDSEGCILVGTNRTKFGVSNCQPMVLKIISAIKSSSTKSYITIQ